jgi:hypothetical protein
MFSFLSPSRNLEHASSVSDGQTISLSLHVPNHGNILMNEPSPDDPDDQSAIANNGFGTTGRPRKDVILSGHLEVSATPDVGRVRCKGVRVAFATLMVYNLGLNKISEQDVLFERKVEIDGGYEGIWIDSVTSR